MELCILRYPTNLVSALFYAFLIFIFYYFYYTYILKSANKGSHKKSVPVSNGSWPVLGHLHLFGGSQLPHITLGNMAEKHGPIFSLNLGVSRPLVVISSWEMAKECLTIKDKFFPSRPIATASEHIGYNYAVFAFSPYGPYWVRMRKIATNEFFSNRCIQINKHIPESEVKSSMKQIYQKWTGENKKNGAKKVVVEMRQWFGEITVNLIFRTVVGKRPQKDYDWRKAVKEVSYLFEMSMLHVGLPFLKWVDLGGYQKAMKKIGKGMDIVLEECLQEHKRNKLVLGEQKDFMGTIMEILDDGDSHEDLQNYGTDTIVKATCLAIILAGTDTTEVTMVWALSLLLNNPNTLKKAQEEVDTLVGKERQVGQTDISNLVYLQAIIKETLRLYPPAPISPTRRSLSDCTVGGYHIAADTLLVLNIHKIHRDKRLWTDPLVFRPERFLTGPHSKVDVKGQNYELIPFSSGRRMCPAVNFALQIMSFTLATFIHGFHVSSLVDGQPVDMSESFGLTNHKANPLNVLLSPRLRSSLYDL